MASASATRPSVAAPSIYGQDDLSKVLVHEMSVNPGMSGTLGAMLLGAGASHQRDVQQYYDQIAAANQLQMALSAKQDQADLLKEALAKGPDWMAQGADISQIPLV